MKSNKNRFKGLVKNIFNIQKGESSAVLLLLSFSFVTGVSFVFYSTAIVSIFISSLKAEMLPYAFIASGVVGYLLWFGFSKIQKVLSFGNLLLYGYIFLFFSIAFLIIMAEYSGNKWWYFFMFIWMRFFTFLNAVMFGGLVARIFNLQQGKRLYALISSGDVVSQMIGYLSIPLLIKAFGLSTLLIISLFGIIVQLLIIIFIKFRYKHFVERNQAVHSNIVDPKSNNIIENKNWKQYSKILFFVSLMPMLGFYYVDYIFLNELRIEYVSKESVAGFLGFFLGGVALVELITRLFLSGRLLTKFGLSFGISVLPAALTISTILIVIFYLLPGFLGLVFAMIALSKLLERVLRFSFNEPAFQIFYQPVPPENRFVFRTMLEGVPKALGVIFAGLLILAFNLLGLKSALYLNLLFLIVLVIWLFISRESYKSYCQMLVLFVHDKFSSKKNKVKAGVDNYDKELENGFKINSPIICISLYEWQEYSKINSLILNENNSFSERKCTEFMLNSILPASYYSRWIQSDPMIAQMLKAKYAVSNSIKEKFRIIELMADSGKDAHFLNEQFLSSNPLISFFVSKYISISNSEVSSKFKNDCKIWLNSLFATIVWYDACYNDINGDSALESFSLEILKEKKRLTKLIFIGLAVLFDSAAVSEIEESLINEPSSEGGMLAYELLENFFDSDIKDKIIAIFANNDSSDSQHILDNYFPQRKMNVNDRLYDIFRKEYSIIPLCFKITALKELCRIAPTNIMPILKEGLQNVHGIIALIAGDFLLKSSPEVYNHSFNTLAVDQKKRIDDVQTDILEKIEFIKNSNINNMVAPAVLFDVAISMIGNNNLLDGFTSGTLIPMSNYISVSDGSIVYHDKYTNIIVINSEIKVSNDWLWFKGLTPEYFYL